jgi:outer membrane receptor protein involved in Fe transport
MEPIMKITPTLFSSAARRLPVAVALAVAAIPGTAYSQVLEEVIVTAQKRAESLMDVPLSVSAVSGDKMMEAGIRNLGDLSAYIPNFQKSETSLGNYLSIRGISSGINQGFEQSVVQYMDDVALGRSPLARAPFMDLNRVEVLRGPQNVLFGKNSIGGALSLITNKPTEEFEGSILVEYEPEYEAAETQLVLSGGITDTLRGRLAVRYLDDDGYFENNLTGDDDMAREETTIRATLAWDMSDTAEAVLKVEHSEFDFDGRTDELSFSYPNNDPTSPFFGMSYAEAGNALAAATGLPMGSDDGMQNYKRNTNIPETSNNETNNYTLTVNWEGDAFSVTSVSAYMDYDLDEALDTDGSGFAVWSNSQTENYDQFSQEIRFTSPGGESFDWIAGAYYQDWDLDFDVRTFVPEGGLFTALGLIANPALGVLADFTSARKFSGDSKLYAAFAQGTWTLSDTIRLTAGARYTYEDKSGFREMNGYRTSTGELDIVQAATANAVFGIDYANLGIATGGAFPIHRLDESRSEDFLTPTLIGEWDVTDGTMLYASVSQGAKAGGFDARGDTAGDFEFEDEEVTAWELGSKSRLADGRLEVNTAIFYSDYTDLQVSQFNGVVGFQVGNAAEATSQGIEVDGRWLITEGLTMTFSGAYLDFEFDEFEGACNGGLRLPGDATCDYSGKANIFSPEWTANASLEYVTGLTDNIDFRGNLDVLYTDEQYVNVTLDDNIIQDGVTRINARLALEGESWSLALVGKNLTDEDIVSFATNTPLANALGTPSYTTYMERPRTIAIQAMYRF